jgi:hypothetical protein
MRGEAGLGPAAFSIRDIAAMNMKNAADANTGRSSHDERRSIQVIERAAAILRALRTGSGARPALG